MKRPFEEKRKYLRLNVPLEIEYSFPDSEKIYRAATKDISTLGIRFETTEKPKKGIEVEIKLKLPSAQNPIHVSGRVAWLDRMGSDDSASSSVGIEFTKIEEDNKNTFLKYLCDLIYG